MPNSSHLHRLLSQIEVVHVRQVDTIETSLDLLNEDQHVNRCREEIFQLVGDFEYLDQKNKKEIIAYLEQYFELSENFKFLISSLERTCI